MGYGYGVAVSRLFGGGQLKEKDESRTVRLPLSLWVRLERIAEAEDAQAKAENKRSEHISRNDVIKKVLSDFAGSYEADLATKGKKGHQ